MRTMRHINRGVAIILPKQPYVDWANGLPDAGFSVTLDDVRHDALAVLILDFDTDEEARRYIDDLAEEIFEYKLWDWCTNENWWPSDRSKARFWEWFDVAVHSEVLDPYEDPIEKEEQ